MFATSRDEMIPREKAMIGTQKIMLTIFFNSVSLMTLNALPSGSRFNQEYFIHNILSDIFEARGRIFHKYRQRDFLCI
jgi:hypothetical protein